MTWALKRQILYVMGVLVFLSAIALYFLWPYFNKAPTCFDGKQNGAETGVDCGDVCSLACIAQVDKLSVFWTRSFEVVPGRYNAVAYIQNQNDNQAINKIKYRFRFADENNLYIGKREGETFIPPRGKFAIFEPAIDLGNSKAVYTTFEFIEQPVWVNVPKEKVDQLTISIGEVKFENNENIPKLSAVLKNNSLFTIPDINAIAILYDEFNNALNVSSTKINSLEPEGSNEVYFTWRNPMPKEVVNKEIIPMYNIFNVELK